MRCPKCSYRLDKNISGACPECGHPRSAAAGWVPDTGVKWAAGLGLALVPIGYGLYGMYTATGVLLGRTALYEVTGGDARVLAVAPLAIGVALHVHFFWGNTRSLAPWTDVGLGAAGVAFIGALAVLAVRMLAF